MTPKWEIGDGWNMEKRSQMGRKTLEVKQEDGLWWEGGFTLTQKQIQGLARRRAPGFVNFIPAAA